MQTLASRSVELLLRNYYVGCFQPQIVLKYLIIFEEIFGSGTNPPGPPTPTHGSATAWTDILWKTISILGYKTDWI